MSDFNAQGLSEDTGDDEEIEYEDDEVEEGEDEVDDDFNGLASNFLADVPEEHRAILDPYVKKWDAGVTRRFQELHGRYKPYADLGGDPETLAQAYQIYQMLETDPKRVYELLAQEYGESVQSAESQNSETEDALQGLPKEWVERVEKQEQILNAIAQHILSQNEMTKQQQEDVALETYLGNLKEEFGDFDEEYVLLKMSKGMEGPKAVKAYQKYVQDILNKHAQKPRLPKVLSGGGAVASDAQSVTELSGSDIKSLVAKALANGQT